MKQKLIFLLLFVCGMWLPQKGSAQRVGTISNLKTTLSGTIKKNILNQSQNVPFIKNEGQLLDANGTSISSIQYYGKIAGVDYFMDKKGITYVFSKNDLSLTDNNRYPDKARTTFSKVRTEFIGMNENCAITTSTKESLSYNYYLGRNKNFTGIAAYKKLTYHDVYPKIDMVVYSIDDHLKYDFVVHPGGNPSSIKMTFKGQDKIKIDQNGNLVALNQLGSLQENKPYTFQNIDGNNTEIRSSFHLQKDFVTFNVSSYNKDADLVIDPARIWGIYLGGGSETGTDVTTMVESGNTYIYVTGYTTSASNIIVGGTTVYQTGLGGIGSPANAFVAKFDNTGNQIWGTYFGQTSTYGNAITNDGSAVYVTGYTNCPTSCTNPSTTGSNYGGGNDVFIAKFSTSGSLNWASFLGGSGSDIGHDIFVNGSYVYIAGETTSTNTIATSGSYKTSITGGVDAFVARYSLTGSATPNWSTYFGGSSDDVGNTLAVETVGANTYVVLGGDTKSTSGIATGGTFQTSKASSGNWDGFVVKINQTSNSISAGTYIGGSSEDHIYGLCIDGNDNYVFVGKTNSISAGATTGGTLNTTGSGSSFDGLLGRLVSSLTLSTYGYLSFIGGSADDQLNSVAVDGNNKIYVVGSSSSTGSGTPPFNFTATSCYINNTNSGSSGTFDAIFMVLPSSISSTTPNPDYFTFYGGSSNDYGTGIALGADGNVYIEGYTGSSSNIKSGAPTGSPSFTGSTMLFLTQWGCNLTAPSITKQGTSTFSSSIYSCGSITLSGHNTNSGTFSYQWYYSSGGAYLPVSGGTSIDLAVNDLYFYSYELGITDNATCCTALSAPVQLLDGRVSLPTVIGPTVLPCKNGGTVNLNVYSPGAASYNIFYYESPGYDDLFISSTTTTISTPYPYAGFTPTTTNPTPTSSVYGVTATSAYGCTTAKTNITITPTDWYKPDGVTIPAHLCPNSTYSIPAYYSSSHGTYGTDYYFTWYDGSGTVIGTGSSFNLVTPTEGLTYNYSVSATNNTTGCTSDILYFSLTSDHIADINTSTTTSADISYCSGGTIPTIHVEWYNIANPPGDNGPFRVEWYYGSLSTSPVYCHVVTTLNYDNYTPSSISDGDMYFVKITGGCTSGATLCSQCTSACFSSLGFTYHDKTPSYTITASSTYACPSGSIPISLNVPTTSGCTYLWEYQDPGSGTGWSSVCSTCSATVNVTLPNTYRATVTRTTSPYCTSTSTVTINSRPDLSFNIIQVGGNYVVTVDPGTSTDDMMTFYEDITIYNDGSVVHAFPNTLTGSGSISYSFTASAGYYYIKAKDKCNNSVLVGTQTQRMGCGVPSYSTTYNGSSTPYYMPNGTNLTSGTYRFLGTIEIASGSTVQLSNCTIFMDGSNAEIIIDAGGELDLTNVHFFSCNTWRGIHVIGNPAGTNGKLVINTSAGMSTISDALIGVYSETGGNLDISNTNFSKNGIHIAISEYKNSSGTYLNHNSTIHGGCTFDELINPSNAGCSAVFTPAVTSNARMVYLEKVTGVTIDGSYFSGVNGPLPVTAIDCYDIQGNVPGNPSGPKHVSNPYYLTITNNRFTDALTTGIYATSYASTCSGIMVFNGNIFGNTGAPKPVNGVILSQVDDCQIGDNGASAASNTFNYLTNGLQYYSSNASSGITYIEHNDFENNTYAFVAAPSVYPISTVSGGCPNCSLNAVSAQMNALMLCNKFFLNGFGIIGCKSLMDQKRSSGDCPDNMFYVLFTGGSRNINWDILWAESTINYYDYAYGLNYNIMTPTTSIYINNNLITSSLVSYPGCGATSCLNSWDIGQISGIDKQYVRFGAKVFPNPSLSTFTLEIQSPSVQKQYKMEVFDFWGRNMLNQMIAGPMPVIIDAENWSAGVYVLKISDENGVKYKQNLIRQK